ncbi:hypothetical protein [Rubinisphaera brasiliensis]|uniref:Uncharacterized protein n=1 Tax=Rubinisphaera brasiliensis (strain ATCC 49424 / DSM 5305 / JCM 21570 / IAM 15109 / NBRC 103401 / IFAM 1448) TaxID=756272 RepID=F0SI26_RUBBR|nr:hypothetical protein [Rubinisphaera brasiliensis]ADY61728.1 hypothetical protein Plabr_4154 [Rubinisphaera brasiliensis DSM 5305]
MNGHAAQELVQSTGHFVAALDRLDKAPAFARRNHIGRLLDTADRVLRQGNVAELYELAPRFDDAGVFRESDWDFPECLQPGLVHTTLTEGDRWTATLECLSLLRLQAIAEGKYTRKGFSAERASHYLREVLALNLEFVFERQTEASRQQADRTVVVRSVMQFLAETGGYENLLDQLVGEIWRLLRQRPIKVGAISVMITKLAEYCYGSNHETKAVPVGAERLISSLYSPSPASREDPGLAVYAERLAAMDANRMQEEATAVAWSMHATGLVSPYHAVLLRYLMKNAPETISVALGLSSTGLDGYLTYRELVHALIDKAVHPETCQCIYGLAGLLERAVLHFPGVASSLWRQIKLPLTEAAKTRLVAGCGSDHPPDVFLLGGVISILGQPLGVGQGDNPTCQSARALSLWAYSDPDYLLQLLAWAGRDDGILMMFHDRQLSSAFLQDVAVGRIGSDLDPVSLVLVPHLDRMYAEMMRLAHKAGQDPHIYVNPEFHGWRVGRGFAIAVDVATGQLEDYEQFIRLFYACYHPSYNGGHPVIHPQPVGLAVTDARARFIGWHAITVLRVALDMDGDIRVYFYNPNNDSGQDWGQGVEVSTEGNGETYGESSLPVDQFVSRLYIFHYDPLEVWDTQSVPQSVVDGVAQQGKSSWASERTSGS